MAYADERFPITTISRAEIATMLNAVLGSADRSIEEFKPNDHRLTDEVCKGIAGEMSAANAEFMDNLSPDEYPDVPRIALAWYLTKENK